MSSKTLPSRWELAPSHPELAASIAERIQLSPHIAQCLLNRGFSKLSEIQDFIAPSPTLELPAFDPKSFAAAEAIIRDCIATNKTIFLFGDYDVDGMSSTSMMSIALSNLGAKVDFYIPQRLKEGYGLNTGILKSWTEIPGCLITLDCGISNQKEIADIKAATNVPVIIFDHHRLPSNLPDANVIINPKTLDDSHPASHLCTAGIVYLFLCTLIPEAKSQELLDLAAMGTVADLVPLQKWNRSIAKEGLLQLGKRESLGIRSLMSVSKLSKPEISAMDIGFVLAPRLNAAGRLSDPKLGVELLTATSFDDAENLSFKLNDLNIKRRSLGESIFQQAKATVEKSPDLPIIALSHTMWHPGIIGITASQLVSEFQKPVVLISETETVGRGSARTIGGVSIFELLSHCEEYFLNFGGHHDAAGFSIDLAKIPDFLARIGEVATEQIDRDTLYSTHKIDAVISVKDIHLDFIDELEILAPFGQGNPEPLFFCKDFTVLDARRIGADGNHLKATLSSLDHEHCVDAIGFKMGDQVSDLMGKHCEIICHIRANEWQGRRMAQANIVEIKVA